jgi:hypothetical protein
MLSRNIKEDLALSDLNSSVLCCRTRKKLLGPFHPSLPLSSHLFVVSHDAKFLFSGGYWDSSLRVYSLAKSKTVASVRRHFGECHSVMHV